MSDAKPLTPDQENNLRAWAKKYAGPNSYALTWLDLFATLDAERARADAALLEGVKAGIEAAAKVATEGPGRGDTWNVCGSRIRALNPVAITRQVREEKRDA